MTNLVLSTLSDALDVFAQKIRDHNYGDLDAGLAYELRTQRLNDIQAARAALREMRSVTRRVAGRTSDVPATQRAEQERKSWP